MFTKQRLISLCTILIVLVAPAMMLLGAQEDVAKHLHKTLRAAGLLITGVSIGDPTNKATWKVQPSTFQAAAQPTIDAFDINDPAHDIADLNAQVTAALDTERLQSAIVWTLIDTYSPPATKAKYANARTQIITAYTAQPWK